jgi:hypothetical protein
MSYKTSCVLFIGGLLVLGDGVGVASPQPLGSSISSGRMSPVDLRRAQQVLAAHEAHLMEIPGVVGVGVGTTEQGERAAIHVFVNVAATGGKIPVGVPRWLEHVPVRVIQTDALKAR